MFQKQNFINDINTNSIDEEFIAPESGMETDNFQYKPSERLNEMEKNLSGELKTFVKDGYVKETLTNTFSNSMKTDVATDGLAGLKQELQQTFNGPEAYRIFDDFGDDLNKIFTSRNGANIINMIASTVHVLLTNTGETNIKESGLGKLLSSLFLLCSSSYMPQIVDKTGELVITMVNKPMAALFARQYWNEWQKMLNQKDLDKKLNNIFNSLSALMKSLHNQKTKITQQV